MWMYVLTSFRKKKKKSKKKIKEVEVSEVPFVPGHHNTHAWDRTQRNM